MPARTRRLAAALLATLGPLALLATWLVLRAELPDPLPTHWDLRGEVDGTTDTEVLLVVTLALSSAFAATAAWLVGRRSKTPADRAFAVGLTWAAWLAASVFGTSAVLAAGAAQAEEVAMPWWAPVGLVLLPLAAGAACHLLVPPAASAVAASPLAYDGDLRLGAGERATWVGSSSSVVPLVVAAVLEVGAVVAALTLAPLALVLALVGAVVFWVHAITVRVDDSGLTASWGPLRWPRVHVGLDDVVSATAEEIDPLAWGGWGYRVTPGATAAVTRRGPGVVVERASGRRFAVTVDDAPEAADLLAALAARQHRSNR